MQFVMNAKEKKIFIADDDADILEIISIMLETQGYKVVTNNNAKDILEYIANELPDLILLDIWMSGLDGRTICEQLKSNNATKNIPVIFISANSNIKAITKEYNADGFISKPFEMDYLFNVVHYNLRNDLNLN
jgi:DNA-binding response OmpR family regulator